MAFNLKQRSEYYKRNKHLRNLYMSRWRARCRQKQRQRQREIEAVKRALMHKHQLRALGVVVQQRNRYTAPSFDSWEV